jgi:hypothetical protein
VVLPQLSNYERTDRKNVGDEEEEEQWGELLAVVDSSRFSSLFRNLVLLSGLLRLHESSEVALSDLQTIMGETQAYSKRVSSASLLHPEVKILEAIQGNLQDFSSQTLDFQSALESSELRIELELMSLCLQLSRSVSPEVKEKKDKFAHKLTKLAQHIRSKEEESKLMAQVTKTSQSLEDENVRKQKDRDQL